MNIQIQKYGKMMKVTFPDSETLWQFVHNKLLPLNGEGFQYRIQAETLLVSGNFEKVEALLE